MFDSYFLRARTAGGTDVMNDQVVAKVIPLYHEYSPEMIGQAWEELEERT